MPIWIPYTHMLSIQDIHCCSPLWSFVGDHSIPTFWVLVTHTMVSDRGRHGCVSWMACHLSGTKPIYLNQFNLSLIGPLRKHSSETRTKQQFSFKKMHSQMSSTSCWPFCTGLIVLMQLSSNPDGLPVLALIVAVPAKPRDVWVLQSNVGTWNGLEWNEYKLIS